MRLEGIDFDIVVARGTFQHDWKNALAWLKAQGHRIGKNRYYERLKELDAESWSRLAKIPQEYHIIIADSIVKLHFIEKEAWKNYHVERDPTKKVRILKTIVELQPYITSIYDQTQDVVENKTLGDVKENAIQSEQEDQLHS